MNTLAIFGPIKRLVGGRVELAQKVSWSTGGYAVSQVLRLATNIVLAALLVPELLGTMLLINTLRTGAELITDVGIGQSIVNNKRGNQPAFYHTAWTMQIIRGPLLFGVALAATLPLADLYAEPELATLLPIAATIFLISGFRSPAKSLLQKRLAIRKIAFYEIGVALFSMVIHIGLALYSPTIWALIGGLLLTALFSTTVSFFLLDWRDHKLYFEKEAFGQIFHFGKWIFFNSLVFFAAMNFDRLYLAEAIPFAVLGVYAVARTFSETATTLFLRVANMIVFPKISATDLRGEHLRAMIRPLRLAMIGFIATALAFGITIADQFIMLAYDDRYIDAATFLPVMLVGTWFAILAAMGEATMMGIGRPSAMTFANFMKIVMIILAVPAVLSSFGLLATIAVFALADAFRYVILSLSMYREKLSFMRQDLVATLGLIVLTLLMREISGWLGLTSGIEGWIAAGGLIVAS